MVTMLPAFIVEVYKANDMVKLFDGGWLGEL